ncbi:MAG: hypothetical protein AAF787_04090 [Chloroflexota bacterium]
MKTKAQAEAEARKIVSDWVKGAVLTGWIPGSALVLTGADYVMMEQVARTFEVAAFDKDHALQSIGTLAASGAAGGVIGEAIGVVPVIGWAVKSGMMGAKAHLIGNAIIEYFKERSPLPDTLPTTDNTAASTPPPAAPTGKVRIQVEDDE